MIERNKHRWQDYEALAYQIMRELLPYADVKLDDHIHGHDSETARQIDVSARWTHGGEEYLLIVQVKDLKAKADVNTVGTFRSVIEDVQAQKGVLICSGGFSKSSVTYARNKGISLYSLEDASSKHWPAELTVPIIWNRLLPEIRMGFTFRAIRSGLTTALHGPNGFPRLKSAGGEEIDIPDMFSSQWNADALDRSIGDEHDFLIDNHGFVNIRHEETGKEDWLASKLKIQYIVIQESWLGHLRPSEYRGLVDHLDGERPVPSSLRIETLPPTPDGKWQKISDPSKVAVDIEGFLLTLEEFNIAPETATMNSFSVRRIG